jgi:hypothetical protein
MTGNTVHEVSFRPLMLTAFLMAALVACDGYMSLEGYAYEWINPPVDANSEIIVDGEPPAGRAVAPIEGVEVRMRAWENYEGMSAEEILATPLDEYDLADSTAADGSFDVGFTVAPFLTHGAVQATKEGFKAAAVGFPHDTFIHRVLVYLVRSDSPEPNRHRE